MKMKKEVSNEERQERLKELIDENEKKAKKRMKICLVCPIYSLRYGGTCNGKLYLNPKTGDVSTFEQDGYFRGCNCVLEDKTRYPDAKCPAGKW